MSEERDEVRRAKLRLKHAKLRKRAARIARKLGKLEGRGREEESDD